MVMVVRTKKMMRKHCSTNGIFLSDNKGAMAELILPVARNPTKSKIGSATVTAATCNKTKYFSVFTK